MPQPVTEIYNNIADWFDAARNKSLIERELLDLIRAHLPEQPEVLDLGCGTAEPIARYFIEHGTRVTGIDGAPAMIAHCHRRFPEQNWITADMRQIDLGQSYDAIIVWDSLFHLNCDDQRAMFPIFDKHARTGTVLIFSCGSDEEEAWSPMRGHDSVQMFHATLNTGEYEQLLARHGFTIIRQAISDKNCGGRSYFIARKAATSP